METSLPLPLSARAHLQQVLLLDADGQVRAIISRRDTLALADAVATCSARPYHTEYVSGALVQSGDAAVPTIWLGEDGYTLSGQEAAQLTTALRALVA